MPEYFTISKEIEFDAGHRVPMHKSKCRNPHGHRYKVVAHLRGELYTEGSDAGMVFDFGDVKTLMMERVHDVLDHGFIVWNQDEELMYLLTERDWKVIEFPYIPTAENIAKWCFDGLVGSFGQATLTHIEVHETPTSKAVYPA